MKSKELFQFLYACGLFHIRIRRVHSPNTEEWETILDANSEVHFGLGLKAFLAYSVVS
jgi:hypothetical protein